MLEKETLQSNFFKKTKKFFTKHQPINFFEKSYKLNSFDSFINNKVSLSFFIGWIVVLFLGVKFIFPTILPFLSIFYSFLGLCYACYSGYIFYPKLLKGEKTNLPLTLKYCLISGLMSILPLIPYFN